MSASVPASEFIWVTGARENNLRDVSLPIPKRADRVIDRGPDGGGAVVF